MTSIVYTLLLLIFSSTQTPTQDVCVNSEEKKLYDLIMEYRKSKKLKPIPFSAKLTQVAQLHVKDLNDHFDYENRGDCNPHSWSDKGDWTPCCYTPDHKQASCMWDKPREIAGYNGNGFEIAYYSSDPATAEEGLDGWKKSSGHNPLLINSGTWAKIEWRAIGIGISGNYGVVWLADGEGDPSHMILCE